MSRIAWLTDIHLNFVGPNEHQAFLDRVAGTEPDAVLIGGDIAEAPDLVESLARLDEGLERPLYFVLGNHDFYRGSIRAVHQQVHEFCRDRPRLHFLTTGEAFELAPGVGLVGHDGWADARVGDYEGSLLMLNDYRLIEELAAVGKRARWDLLKELGDEAAEHIRRVLPVALARFNQVLLLTHVPPTREACWHDGRSADDEWAPHFTCKAVGDAILEIMREWTDRRLTVLCGHTHSPGECQPLENVTIYTGGAEYGRPDVQRVFEF